MADRLGLLVIGGGPAALAAATSYRESGGEGVVRIVSADPHPPYDRPPLSKELLRGESEVDDLPLQEQDAYDEQRVELVLGTRVTALDVEGRTARTDAGDELAWDACVLATGSTPSVPPVEGADDADLVYLRTWEDGERLRTLAGKATSAVVVGSGFIGCEAAISLARRGLEVTVLSQERLPQEERLGEEVAGRIAGWLREAGVTLLGGQQVSAIERAASGYAVRVGDVEHVADLVLVATGATPDGGLAEEAGLEVEGGRVVADEHLATSAPGVWVAGDVAHATHAAAGRPVPVEHWGDAEAMGEVAGANAAGGDRTWSQVPGFWTDLGEHTLQYAAWGDGWDEVHLVEGDEGAFTVWYAQEGRIVGVLTHDADDDYDRGQGLVESGAPIADVIPQPTS